MSDKEELFLISDVSGDVPDPAEIDNMLEEFRAPQNGDGVQIIEPIASGTADALTAAPKAKPAPAVSTTVEDINSAANDDAAPTDGTTADNADDAPQKRNWLMRFLGAIVPHIGDEMFDIVRKCIMLTGILVFVGAATYLIDDLILIPRENEFLVSSLQAMYTPNLEQELSEEEANYPYPEGMDPSFKKLYYENNDLRGWISYHSTDGVTVNCEYPITQSADNDFYLFHDYYGTYNKNGTLFFDYRNTLSSPDATNRNTIIYGHNMASGQMFAGLNRFLDGVNYARVAPTFTMNTLYEKHDYKVFAVMVINNNIDDGIPFGYLKTDFVDNVEFATFLSEILARSIYVYGDVDLRPDDEIVTLSTCSEYSDVHFNDGRTVVVARRVRDGEDPSTDVSLITRNDDVIMPYAWYVNQDVEPHPYYTDANYVIQPLDTLMSYLQTSTAPVDASGSTSTSFTLYYNNSTFGLASSVTNTLETDAEGNIIGTITQPQATKPYMQAIEVESTPKNYKVGQGFDYANTTVYGVYSDGTKVALNPRHCAITGFNTAHSGTCYVTLHYGTLRVSFFIKVDKNATAAPTTPTATVPTPTSTTVTKPTTTATEPVETTAPTETTTTTVSVPVVPPVDEAATVQGE